MNVLSSLSDKLDQALKYSLIFLMGFLVVDVCWQVLTRYIFTKPSSFTEEVARYLLIWIGLLGAAHAYRHGMHLGLNLLSNSASAGRRKAVNLFIQLVTLFFASSVLIYGGIKLCLLAFHLDQISAALQINMGIVYLALPISGFLFVLFALEKIVIHDNSDVLNP